MKLNWYLMLCMLYKIFRRWYCSQKLALIQTQLNKTNISDTIAPFLIWLCWGLMSRQPLWVILCCPREREKKDRRDSRGGDTEGRKKKMNEREVTEEIKTLPLYPYLLQGQQALPNCKPISVGRPGDKRYTTPLPHPEPPPSSISGFKFV